MNESSVAVIAATKPAANDDNVRALRLRQSGGLWQRLGNVGDGFAWRSAPLAAIKIALRLGIKMIVGQGIPVAEWRVIISHARQVKIIGVVIFLRDGRGPRLWRTTAQSAGG